MAIVGPHREDDLRFAGADDLDDLQLFFASGADVAVAEVELFAKARTEYSHSVESLAAADFRSAARAQLAARQLDDADAQAVGD